MTHGEDDCNIVYHIDALVYVFDCPAQCCSYGYGKNGLKHYGVFRYAGGLWLQADGKKDMAFIGYTPYNHGRGGAPIFYGLEIKMANKTAYDSACNLCSKLNGCASGYTVQIENCTAIMGIEYAAAVRVAQKGEK